MARRWSTFPVGLSAIATAALMCLAIAPPVAAKDVSVQALNCPIENIPKGFDSIFRTVVEDLDAAPRPEDAAFEPWRGIIQQCMETHNLSADSLDDYLGYSITRMVRQTAGEMLPAGAYDLEMILEIADGVFASADPSDPAIVALFAVLADNGVDVTSIPAGEREIFFSFLIFREMEFEYQNALGA